MFKPVVVVPVYNHPRTIGTLVQAVRGHGVPCILVDDGSEPGCAAELARLALLHSDTVQLVKLPSNQGKGGAMIAGLREAARLGHTHALQIDADGQHSSEDIPVFLAKSQEHPDTVICGCPVYDHTVPKVRLYGRYGNHIFVWINTLSLDIRDSMCGFRVYPMAPTMALINSHGIGRRMDFDSDIMVRLHWRRVPVINQPTRVTYPRDGISHFRLWRDNVLLVRMHALMFFGMLLRSPVLLWRKMARP